MKLPAAALAVLAALCLAIASARCARAHDRLGSPNWIANGHYTSPIDGSHCCGVSDCAQVDPDAVRELSQGYLINGYVQYPGSRDFVREIVPHAEVQASKDGNYWRCKRGDGGRRCYFAPPPSY